jgi:ferredoxin--NADP+ reductase
VGRTTVQLGKLNEGDYILDVVGPLGKQFEIDEFGRVICVGGGVGVAPIYPVARALKRAGNEVISVIGARSRDYLILVEEMKAVSDQLFTATDDGSAGQQGCAPDVLKKILEKEAGIGLVVAMGPLVMMKAVAELTRPYQIKTVVSLNPIMVDGTGMCGACRVTVGGETRFACVDGPAFDGHLVDWPVVIQRARMFRAEEKKAMEIYCTGSDCLCQIR